MLSSDTFPGRFGKPTSMKPTAQKITVIVVFVLVLLFGVGQFFAFSNSPHPNTNPQESNTTAGPQATQVVYYTPQSPTSSTPVVSGSCWANSLVAPFRPDAWRCAVKNGDPCFEISGSTSTLLCGVDPKDPTSSTTFVLSLTQPLPTNGFPVPPPPTDWAWLIELQDGTLCSLATPPPISATDGEIATYGCAPKYGGDDRMIFGELNTSSDLWTAEVGTLSASTSSPSPTIIASSTISIVRAWQ